MRHLGKFLLVIVAAASLTLAGCAATGGPSAPVSADVAADVATERSILAAISNEPGLNATTIGVSCINGVVTLRGSVESAIERQLAERVASGISGVSSVNNLLTFN